MDSNFQLNAISHSNLYISKHKIAKADSVFESECAFVEMNFSFRSIPVEKEQPSCKVKVRRNEKIIIEHHCRNGLKFVAWFLWYFSFKLCVFNKKRSIYRSKNRQEQRKKTSISIINVMKKKTTTTTMNLYIKVLVKRNEIETVWAQKLWEMETKEIKAHRFFTKNYEIFMCFFVCA